jgi:hypothetical protein
MLVSAPAMQNSNPTILNAADLPTRQRSLPSCKTDLYDRGIFANPWSSDVALSEHFAGGYVIPSDSDDEFIEEPIDEQEVYGMYISHCPFLLPSQINLVAFTQTTVTIAGDISHVCFPGRQTSCPPFQIPNTQYL